MGVIRKAVLATSLIGAGLAATSGAAFAHESDWDGGTVQKGLINSSDFAPNTPINVCNNDVPVNVLGVQVPVQDNAGSIPLLSDAKKGNSAGISKSCSNPISAVN
ncbi:hypothetical protein [Actinomycetospora termitidis]|uniref:RdlA protein n=1 Tax=Actinomycetospora termitidis TaxID=3053470 RepID=A0ABT7M2J1_9PSEU|nr:hypothetical protein [Actinomycetospora sp. Odt1-22]MDL5154646.1 hypothetical protein [Actinomycetospora sp. Odt1-22]